MDEQTKRKMIRNYFKAFPKGVFWVIVVVGVLFLISGIGNSDGGIIILGLIVAGIGGYGIYFYDKRIPTDQQVDEWLEEDLKGLNKRALEKMGVDETELVDQPVQITGLPLGNAGGLNILYKRGKDNIIRFTPIDISIINFTKNQLLRYSCILDFTTGSTLNESTDEYFYKDVVSITTKTESKEVNIPKLGGTIKLTNAEMFTLTTSGGTSISVMLRDPTLIKKMGGGDIPITRAEKAIQTVRKWLREKKA